MVLDELIRLRKTKAMAIDFSLCRFHSYLLGSPNVTVVSTDHFPLISIFNAKRSGSTRPEEIIKLRYENIRFYVIYRKGQHNPADYLSRHDLSWDLLNKLEKKESNDSINLLYLLCVSPVIDAISI